MKQRTPKRNGLLTSLQVAVLSALHAAPDAEQFYLTGGTALAEFYLGHRRSFDLDLFTAEQALVLPFSRAAEEWLRKGDLRVSVVRRLKAFAEFEIHQGQDAIRIQFAYDSPYRFAAPIETELGWVNDFRDLVVDKLLAFFGRAEPRDAVDLAFIFREVDPWELIELAATKDPGFDLYWFARAIEKVQRFPDETERWPVDMVLALCVPELKARFQGLADVIMARLGPKEA